MHEFIEMDEKCDVDM